MNAAYSAFDTGKIYLDSAKGIFYFVFWLSLFNILFLCIIYLLYIVDTVASTVESTKKSAQSSIDTGKSYVDSAKGK